MTRTEAKDNAKAKATSNAKANEAPTAGVLDTEFLRRLEHLRLLAAQPTNPLGERPGHLRMPAADVVDHRPYSPGDEIRHVDWHALARHDELIVRLGNVTRGADVCLVLDRSPSMALEPSKWRMAIEICAAIGWIAIAGGDRARLCLLDQAAGDSWRGPAQAPRFLERLAGIGPAPTDAGSLLGPTLAAVGREEGRGGLLIVISDLWLDDDLDEAIAALAAPRWEAQLVQILAEAELAPRLSGPVALVDVESGQRLEMVVDEHVLADYQAGLRRRLDEVANACALGGAAHAVVSAESSLEAVVLPLLRRRAHLR